MHAYHVEKRSCRHTCLDCCSKVAVTQNKNPKPPADFAAMSAVPKSVSDAFKRFDADGTLGYHLYSFVIPSHPLREDTAEMLFQSIEEAV